MKYASARAIFFSFTLWCLCPLITSASSGLSLEDFPPLQAQPHPPLPPSQTYHMLLALPKEVWGTVSSYLTWKEATTSQWVLSYRSSRLEERTSILEENDLEEKAKSFQIPLEENTALTYDQMWSHLAGRYFLRKLAEIVRGRRHVLHEGPPILEESPTDLHPLLEAIRKRNPKHGDFLETLMPQNLHTVITSPLLGEESMAFYKNFFDRINNTFLDDELEAYAGYLNLLPEPLGRSTNDTAQIGLMLATDSPHGSFVLARIISTLPPDHPRFKEASLCLFNKYRNEDGLKRLLPSLAHQDLSQAEQVVESLTSPAPLHSLKTLIKAYEAQARASYRLTQETLDKWRNILAGIESKIDPEKESRSFESLQTANHYMHFACNVQELEPFEKAALWYQKQKSLKDSLERITHVSLAHALYKQSQLVSLERQPSLKTQAIKALYQSFKNLHERKRRPLLNFHDDSFTEWVTKEWDEYTPKLD